MNIAEYQNNIIKQILSITDIGKLGIIVKNGKFNLE